MGIVYGYARVSTSTQNIERQIRNILREYPDARLYEEVYTGTKVFGRKEFEKLLNRVREGDTIVFDSVSRMSRTAEEGFALYKELCEKGVDLVFLKEPHINTMVYKEAMKTKLRMTGDSVDIILKAINEYMLLLVEEQVKLCFNAAEAEVTTLRRRTKEGLETARLNGKELGRKAGCGYETKKAKAAKLLILKHNKGFGGNLTNEETWRLARISKNSFYKYMEELKKMD